MSGTNPLEHVVQHPIKEIPLDAGLLTPEGVVTLMSDHIAMTILAGLVLCLLLPLALRRSRKSGEGVDRLVTTGFAGAIEAICEYLRKEVAEPTLGEHTDRFIKYVWSLFFFVLTINLLGMLPIGVITPLAFGVHIGGTATGNIWVTGTLAVMTLLMMVINGLRLGKVEYLKHFCPGPWWMAPILVPVEIAGLLAKAFALAVRLFANMLAGHLILAVLLGFILSAGSVSTGAGLGVAIPAVLGSVGISLLELFVAFLQAFIFTFLTTLFIGMSVVFHHDDHEEATAH
ncbi:MAG: F0F1 ATP synthase subunit A [Acidobacteria bacterium]|nr:F0F1 ATP synthase subunit A [Acidobacteriota bacterium]